MFSVGDLVIVTELCSIKEWVGLTGTVTNPKFGRSGRYVQIKLDEPILGYLDSLELDPDRYVLLEPPKPIWEI